MLQQSEEYIYQLITQDMLNFLNKIIGEIKKIIKASRILIIRHINKKLSSKYKINYINDRSGRRSHSLTNDIIMCNN